MWNTWITVFGIVFIFIMTTLGAAVVFFFKGDISPKINVLFLGFASGIMLAASVWSLLLPAIEQASETWRVFGFVPAVVGFLIGGAFLVALDGFTSGFCRDSSLQGEQSELRLIRKKCMRLFFAVTLHNVPEGLAVGFAFGAAFAVGNVAAYMAALGLAIGIGLQNFPEGAAISLPMKAAAGSNRKAFLWGAGSGLAEPIFACIGYFLATSLRFLQPWLLAFSAGAMVFVAAEDLIPDAKLQQSPHLGAWGVLIGFALMMALDVALS